GPWGARIVLVTGVVALLSAWNAALFAASRLLHALGADGALPRWFAKVHPRHGTPANAILFVGLVALAGGLMGRAFIEPLIQMGALGFAAAFIAASLACFAMSARAGGAPLLRAAALVGALCLGGVVMLSLVSIFGRSGGAGAEGVALASWVLLGFALWLLAGFGRRRAAEPG